MSGPDPALEAGRRREAERWGEVAAEDLRVTQACLAMDAPALGAAAYHCQQAAEKVVKGLLIAAGVGFRKTHDIDELADLAAPHYPDLQAHFDAIRPYTVWGVAYRYPAVEEIAEPVPKESDLRQAVAIIARLCERLRSTT